MEWDFLVDQRNDREQVIGGVDKEVPETWNERDERKRAEEKRLLKEERRCDRVREDTDKQFKDFLQYEKELWEEPIFSKDQNDLLYVPTESSSNVPSEPSQNNLALSNFVAECDLYQISYRAGAALAMALLKDLGLQNILYIVDKRKLRK